MVGDKLTVKFRAVEHFSLINEDDIGIDLVLIRKLNDRNKVVVQAVKQPFLHAG